MPLDLQPIDLLLLVVLALAALSGWRRGFAMVLLGYAGLLLGLALGAWAATRLGFLVQDGGWAAASRRRWRPASSGARALTAQVGSGPVACRSRVFWRC